MAEVTSGKLTAVILSSGEAEALGDLLHQHETLNEDFPVLDDLANALAGHSIDEDEVDQLYWSNTGGWVSYPDADVYSEAERTGLNLPMEGKWVPVAGLWVIALNREDEAVQARPVIPMVGLIPSGDGPSTMPGAVTAAFSSEGTYCPMVEIWFQSPTGDASDSQIFRLDCATKAQADMIAAQWRALWSLR